MKILLIAPWTPGPTRPRVLGLMRHLAEAGHEIAVVHAKWAGEPAPSWEQLDLTLVEAVPLWRPAGVWRSLGALLSGASLQVGFVDSPALRKRIQAVMARFNPDIVFFNVLRTAQFVALAEGRARVIDLDEIRSSYYEQLSRMSTNWAWRHIAALEARRMRRLEADLISSLDSVIVSSPSDVAKAGGNAHLVRTPLPELSGVPVDGLGGEERAGLIFLGRLNYRANVEGLAWFVRNVMPTFASSGVALNIVGQGAGRRVRRLRRNGVNLIGAVADVDPHLRAASVSVIPVFMATGVQMKLLESLRSGTPVVCTPRVADLAGVSDGVHCLTATSPREWTSAITRLVNDPELVKRLTTAGREWLEETYGSGVIARAVGHAFALA